MLTECLYKHFIFCAFFIQAYLASKDKCVKDKLHTKTYIYAWSNSRQCPISPYHFQAATTYLRQEMCIFLHYTDRASPGLTVFVANFSQNPLLLSEQLKFRLTYILSNFLLPMEFFVNTISIGANSNIGQWQGWPCIATW